MGGALWICACEGEIKFKNLFTLRDLLIEEIENILSESSAFCDGYEYGSLKGKIACNLFFEPSTRTQYSFQMAQERLGMRVITFNTQNSSLQKNESFYDSVKTFDGLQSDLLVIRHSKEKYYQDLIGKIKTPIINGGDGSGDHPTQSLLDILTIKQEFGSLDGMNISIVGDISHSRVARTNFEVMSRFGAKVFTSGPKKYCKKNMNFISFDQAISKSDVIIMLRVQHERHKEQLSMSPEEYNEKYGLNLKNVKLMKKNAIIMHPGPVNRNVELSSELVESSRSRISKQVKNGVFVRMAVIKYLFDSSERERRVL
ncbi:MAG: aspartate carbamoyltransferase catalytic subunit [Oscillospiraceae bacterium]|nr:aspartate carbamoyltransferase catalytic subunit [Oscillospiraceae bacterium]